MKEGGFVIASGLYDEASLGVAFFVGRMFLRV